MPSLTLSTFGITITMRYKKAVLALKYQRSHCYVDLWIISIIIVSRHFIESLNPSDFNGLTGYENLARLFIFLDRFHDEPHRSCN